MLNIMSPTFSIKNLQKHQGFIITTTVKPFYGTTTRGSGLNRLIKKSRYDLINARRLSSEIYKCLDNPMVIRKLGINARTKCVNEFNRHVYMQKLLKIYKKITDNNE